MKAQSIMHWLERTYSVENMLVVIIVLFVLWLMGHFVVRFIMQRLSRLKFKHFPKTAPLVVQALASPLAVIVYAVGIDGLLDYLNAPQSLTNVSNQLFTSWILLNIGFILYQLIPSLMQTVSHIGEGEVVKITAITRSFLTTLFQVLMVLIIMFAVLETWHINVNGLFASVGLAGLAVSMAAQDQIRNFLGGAVIITEKSFAIGDKVQSPSIAGVVEDITFRSTKLRTGTGALQIVPNATLANEPITNLSRVDVPRIIMDYYLDVQTTQAQIKAYSSAILDFLAQDQRFLAKHMEYQVNTLDISNAGIHVQVTGPLSDFGQQQGDATKADLNLAMIRLADAQKIHFVQAPVIQMEGN